MSKQSDLFEKGKLITPLNGVKEIEFEIGNKFSLNKKINKYSKYVKSTEEETPTWTAFVMIKNQKDR